MSTSDINNSNICIFIGQHTISKKYYATLLNGNSDRRSLSNLFFNKEKLDFIKYSSKDEDIYFDTYQELYDIFAEMYDLEMIDTPAKFRSFEGGDAKC